MDPREPIENAPNPAQNSKFFQWLDNVWYHYKWHILIGLFIVFTVTVCVVQCAGRQSYDARIVYAGGKIFSSDEIEVLGNSVAQIVPKDYDGNGKKTAQVVSFPLYADGTMIQGNIEAEKNFGNFLNTGECSVWLVSKTVYESFRLSERAVPLAEIVGEDVRGIDDYAIPLEKTEFYKQFSETIGKIFPTGEEMYLVLGKSTILGRAADERQYERDRALYLAMIG